MTHCHRCNRTLTRPPVVIGGVEYGPTCAKTIRPARDPLESDLFTGIDLDGAVLQARERVGAAIDAAVSRELADMLAGWRATA